VIIGAGPIGCEMAQTFQRLGSQVTLIDVAPHILIREDADAAAILQRRLQEERVSLLLNTKVTRVDLRDGAKVVVVEQPFDSLRSLRAVPSGVEPIRLRSGLDPEQGRRIEGQQGRPVEVACEAILVGVGRAPNTEGLNLEVAGVAYDKAGVKVNDFLRTTNPRIYAAGDICAPFKFTHTANALGRMAMINALFWGRNRMSRLVVPWCTYTDPEIAHVGLYEQQAKERGYQVTTLTAPLSENDRALLDGEAEGFVRVHLKQGTDTILGATVVAAHAGDLLTYFTLTMATGKGLSALANPIYPYPTQSEVLKRLANLHLQTKLSPRVKRLLSLLLALKR
jgi:pyruvate/2-oxoglutarate dehydrogenase complex dihydrolipoamide dehydrogenase (E3) component